MRSTFATFLCIAGLTIAPLSAEAQTPSCGGAALAMVTAPGGVPDDTLFVSVDPVPVVSSEPIQLHVGKIDYVPGTAVATVDGSTIQLTYTAQSVGLDPPIPLACATVALGPLAAGTYDVRLSLIDTGSGNPAPAFLAAGSLVVGGATAPLSAPTLGGLAKGLLAMMLLALAWGASRRRI